MLLITFLCKQKWFVALLLFLQITFIHFTIFFPFWKISQWVVLEFYYDTLFILMSPIEASVVFILLCIDFTSK